MTSPLPRSRAIGGLGERLRTVREEASLSGAGLATLLGAGWTQSKVSKIETGRQLPTAGEVHAWARATNADEAALLALRSKASAEYAAHKERITTAGGIVARHDEIGALAHSSTRIVEYQPAMVPGWLQTPSYMREMIIGDETLVQHGLEPDQVGTVIATKLRQQAIMYEPGRDIIHVVGEAALRTRIGGMTVATLRGQLAHLTEMSGLPGHTFGIVPFSVVTPFTPLSGWSMYDHDLVSIETLDGSVQITEPSAISRYARWLEQLLEVALTGADAAEFCRQVGDSLVEPTA